MSPKVIKHFKVKDPVLHEVFTQNEDIPELSKKHPDQYFLSLIDEIISQQLSGKAADVIFTRFKDLFKGKTITPRTVLNVKDEQIRAVGISFGKIKYIKDLAQKVLAREVVLDQLDSFENEQIITHLTQVKGIGKWTAEMFLMFTLGRKDIFSHGDLGLKTAIKRIYSLENPTVKQIEEITQKWQPYRTYASLILWKSLNNR